ncbi:inorganic phosphate transporter [Malaciobacter halophilus]|uniref:Phosphate transporter n=1 Tax=Malaciobacter halophilus TaxID=197482 RepID=A0A2N1J129_9BACT|nr:inorganic phosphate transporter [Malaciobacter halophilus]AXH08485.1 inorganic phosphate transporter, PitA family [Malaciobacter halophilus]PKI80268.1 inorganic phosphate transporter [Malaciobacter halophilus]
MDFETINKMDKATDKTLPGFAKLSLGLLFIVVVFLWSYTSHGNVPNNSFLIIGAVFGAYMAMNIGANDVANNVGPAVGSKAMTMFWAIVIAATFEAAGALIAGGDVVKTIKKGIIDPALISDPDIFIWAMTAALLSAAIWLNFATSVGAPVSTTHSIVGGVMGAGIAAAGFSIVSWGTMGKIAASWIISPLFGGIIAAGFLFFIKKNIMFQKDMVTSAKKFVPYLVAVMSWAFSTYLILKGVKRLIKLDFLTASIIGLFIAVAVYFLVKPLISKAASKIENNRTGINSLFTIPLIFAAALLSFAHGANDVANAIGPLAAINDAVVSSAVSTQVGIPFWVMAVGAIGIAIGLALYGPKLIKTVGSEITELDQVRAYAIAMAAAVTVIIASQLGLPVSSTHIAVGGVFGVGFLREFLDSSESKILSDIRKKLKKDKKTLDKHEKELIELEDKEKKSKSDYIRIVELYKLIEEKIEQVRVEKRDFKAKKRVKYVKRDAVKKIVAAWVITVPAAACLSASIFFMIKGIMS